MWREIPYTSLEALLLDAGNTLVSMDLEQIQGHLAELGVRAEIEAIARAEAAARPALSRAVQSGSSTEGRDGQLVYLEAALETLLPDRPATEREALAGDLAARLRQPEVARGLWGRVLPGVPAALDTLRSLGLRLVVVSNSDGSIDAQLEAAGLRDYLDAVIDSHHVGVEKPDPEIFAHGLSAARAAPERALHVGDLYAADVLGARAAGVHAALLDPFGDWAGVDCVRFTDLAALAQRLLRERG